MTKNLTTTTTPAPITTLAPVPVPTTLEGNITDSNYICLRFEFSVHFIIKYKTIQNKVAEANLTLPLDSKLSYPVGICNSTNEQFNLTGNLANSSIILQLTFEKNDNLVYLSAVNLTLTYQNQTFPNINSTLISKYKCSRNFLYFKFYLLDTIGTFNLSNFNPNFSVEKSHSYFCANVTIPREDNDFKVVFSSLKLQAFMDKSSNGEFSSGKIYIFNNNILMTFFAEHNCQNEINDVVPIAVGAALTGLVVIVMIAYFIGRRRSRRLAYQSV